MAVAEGDACWYADNVKGSYPVSRTGLVLKMAVLRLRYFVSSFFLGVETFVGMAMLTSEARKLARDMRAALHGELRETLSPYTINRLANLCVTMKTSEARCQKTHGVARLMLEPMVRNIRENREMMEEVVRTWRESSAAETAES